jgi:Ni/Co efflux regulator RcnB
MAYIPPVRCSVLHRVAGPRTVGTSATATATAQLHFLASHAVSTRHAFTCACSRSPEHGASQKTVYGRPSRRRRAIQGGFWWAADQKYPISVRAPPAPARKWRLGSLVAEPQGVWWVRFGRWRDFSTECHKAHTM